MALSRSASGGVEVYGESPARPVFSAEFDMAPQRAAVLALSELRLPPETAPLTLEEVLPKPAVNPVENDLSRNALPYATALAGACPRLAPAANVLPPEHRRYNSRAVYVPTVVLGGALLLVAGAAFGYSKYSDQRYLDKLHAEIARIEPAAQRAAALDRQTPAGQGADRAARPAARPDPRRPGRAQRAHPADRAAGVDQFGRPDARRGAHCGGGSAGSAAAEDPGLVAAILKLGARHDPAQHLGGQRRDVPDPHHPGEVQMTVGTLDRRMVRMILASAAAMLVLRFVLLRPTSRRRWFRHPNRRRWPKSGWSGCGRWRPP